jgi:hypothetical protein
MSHRPSAAILCLAAQPWCRAAKLSESLAPHRHRDWATASVPNPGIAAQLRSCSGPHDWSQSRSRRKCSDRSSAWVLPIRSPLWELLQKGDHGNSRAHGARAEDTQRCWIGARVEGTQLTAAHRDARPPRDAGGHTGGDVARAVRKAGMPGLGSDVKNRWVLGRAGGHRDSRSAQV